MQQNSCFLVLLLACGIVLMSCAPPIVYPAGGYNYSKDLTGIDTNNYSYPVAHLMGTKDSFNSSYYGRYFGKGYNEPNMSLRPFGKDVFRLLYEDAFGKTVIFILTENELVVKENNEGSPYPQYDSTKLTALEKLHYETLSWNFPLQDTAWKGGRKKRFDSLIHLYPKLTDQAYYKYLLDKSVLLKKEAFAYTTKRIPISRRKFYNIVSAINASGYWKMPYHNPCSEDFLHGFGFMLEANTAAKYNAVTLSCPGAKSDFVKACQQLIDAAKLEDNIRIYSGEVVF